MRAEALCVYDFLDFFLTLFKTMTSNESSSTYSIQLLKHISGFSGHVNEATVWFGGEQILFGSGWRYYLQLYTTIYKKQLINVHCFNRWFWSLE